MTKKTKSKKQDHICSELAQQYEAKLVEYQQALNQAKERELKALADYNNLIKRQTQNQAQLAQLASLSLVEKLLSPLDHLSLAAEHLNDPGIDMVVKEFWQVLNSEGLKEINPLNQEFDERTMEAVEKVSSGTKVKKVLKKGYQLHNNLIQPARVVVG